MQEFLKKKLEKRTEGRKKSRGFQIVLAACSLFVVAAVVCALIVPGFAESEEDTVNEALTVAIKTLSDTAETGQSLSAHVFSQYSKANKEDASIPVCLKITGLSEKITLLGFDENGNMNASIAGKEEERIAIHMEAVTEDGATNTYVTYTQPAGSTLEFDLTFKAVNGLLPQKSVVNIAVDENQTGNGTDKVEFEKDGLDLTWTAVNVWSPVTKTVNSTTKSENEIGVDSENKKLSGDLNYTIKAECMNDKDFGAIYTKSITVTDTLTLPQSFSLPQNAKVDENGTKIVDESGNTVLEFTDLQGGTVDTLTIDSERKKITYSLTIPNSHMDEQGIPTGEQDNLNLTMVLHAGMLVLPDDYTTRSATDVKKDVIENKVTIQPNPYQEYQVDPSSATAKTTPVLNGEVINLEKTATTDRKNSDGKYVVKRGETIKYGITLSNDGTTPIEVKNGDGNYYCVEDKLPTYLTLTPEQKAELEKKDGVTVEYNNQEERYLVQWIPSESNIQKGEKHTLEFVATVKSGKIGLENNEKITNTASYKGENTSADVLYQAPNLTIKKEADKNEVYDGDTITYTITVKNDSEVDATEEETVTDTLPTDKGLEFVSAKYGNTELTSGTSITAHDADTGCKKEHSITFTNNNNTLEWKIGCLGAGESLELSYTCKLNTRGLTTLGDIKNVASISSKKAEVTVKGKESVGVKKEAVGETDKVYKEGDKIPYKITVTNVRSDEKELTELTLEDTLPIGMLPSDEDYEVKDSGNQTVSWQTVSSDRGKGEYTTTIDGKAATVKSDSSGKIIIKWSIETLQKDTPFTVEYNAVVSKLPEGKEDACNKYVNIAKVDRVTDDATVYVGENVGDLVITKYFSYTSGIWSRYEKASEQELDSIEFVITGTDKNGQQVYSETIPLSNFIKGGDSNEPSYTYKLNNIPVGTYTITEKNYNQREDYTVIPEFYLKNDNGSLKENCLFTVDKASQTNTVVYNTLHNPATVFMQKSVYAIVQDGAAAFTSLPDKELFAQNGDTYVIYSLLVGTGGEIPVELKSFKDQLPEGLTFVGISPNAYGTKQNFKKETITTDGSGTLMNYSSAYSGVKITPEYDESSNVVTFLFGDLKTENYLLDSGKAFSFLVLCKVDESKLAEGVSLPNTAELTVSDDVIVKNDTIYSTKNTPYDSNQNNGNITFCDNGDGTQTITSSVSVKPYNIVVPGIEKNAIAYRSLGDTTDQGDSTSLDEANIQPKSAVKWEIKLYNNGTVDMTNYQVEDSVTNPFHLMMEGEAKSYGIDAPYLYRIYSCDGKLIKSYDLSQMMWNDLTEKISNYTFEFSGEEYTIPAGGYATLTFYTNNVESNYKIYKNTATLIPSQQFDANEVRNGELIKDSEGVYTGVAASDAVYSYGWYASVSWKTISEKENPDNFASGSQNKNYISLGLETDRIVTYTNNIKNVSQSQFSDFVVIDLLPQRNDTGVVNQDDKRASEFRVLYNGNMEVYVLDKDGKKIANPSYTVQYSDEISFTEAEFNGEKAEGWHNNWQEGDCSFRVILDSGCSLEKGQTLVISYDGKIGSDALPGAIAWNSFGYQYYAEGNSQSMRAEPPKVGVRIPRIPSISKEVVDENNNVLDKDDNVKFAFELYKDGEKLSTFNISQGGYVKLTDLKDLSGNALKLENGTTYTLKEVNMPDGYELVGIGEMGTKLSDSEYEFTYYDNKDLSIVARNRITGYELSFPNTGAPGNRNTTAGCLLLMMFAMVAAVSLRKKVR